MVYELFISDENFIVFFLIQKIIYFCAYLFTFIHFTELPEKPCVLPEFVDTSHRLHYHLSKRGRTVTDRVVSVLGYACPDITYCSALYPLAALFLHYMPGKWI